MSLATASMTKNAGPPAPMRANTMNLSNALVQNCFSNHDLSNMVFAQKAYGLATANTCSVIQPLKLHMPSVSQLAHENRSSLSSIDPLSLVQAAAQNVYMTPSLPAVDMFVLPSTNAQQEDNTKSDVVKVSYTSAEDLADALFPTTEKQHKVTTQLRNQDKHLRALSQHRKLVHDGLLDHKEQLQSLGQHREMVHAGLIDHRNVLRDVHKSVSLADEGLRDHKTHIEQLRNDNAMSQKRLKDISVGVEDLTKQFEMLRKDTDLKTQSINNEVRELKNGMNIHTKALADQHSEIDNMKFTHAALENTQANTAKEISSLSRSLSARVTNVDLIPPRRPEAFRRQ